MQPKIIILGTRYRIQCRQESNGEVDKGFRELVRKICSDNQVMHIAEEMSYDGLQEQKSDKTIAYEVASERRIEHSYLDPGHALRTKLGIDNDVLTNVAFDLSRLNGKDVDTLRVCLQSSIAKPMRQRIWMAKMLGINLWPKLFICCESHVKDLEIIFKELVELKAVDLTIQTFH